MTEILQNILPYDISLKRPLPGVAPLEPKDWLIVDGAYNLQMEERERILKEFKEKVVAQDPIANESADELLIEVLSFLTHKKEYQVFEEKIKRPDSKVIKIDFSKPLETLGKVVQNDFCILQKINGEHILTAAILCFPASWSLEEKFMRNLSTIHEPVESYDKNIESRVQRLFDGLQLHRPLWRFNVLEYEYPDLFQPRTVKERQWRKNTKNFRYIRSERQTFLRLPKTGAIAFSIHTSVLEKSKIGC